MQTTKKKPSLIFILAAKHTDCLKLSDNTFSLLTIDTEILLDLIHTDSFVISVFVNSNLVSGSPTARNIFASARPLLLSSLATAARVRR